jgi:hypothetical protein
MHEQATRFIATDCQLSMQQQIRNLALVVGHQMGSPKPQG